MSKKEKSLERILEASSSWLFDPFALTEATNNEPLKHMMLHLFKSYGFAERFKIEPNVIVNFFARLEQGYTYRHNPYHNNMHATDVTQTVHYMLSSTGLKNWFTDIELFSVLLSASIHDFDHMGTTNTFQVMTSSDLALIYNDRSVQENHHLSRAFFLLKEDNCNILSNLSDEEYRAVRIYVIDAVMATDMAYHFQHFKDLKTKLPHYVTGKEKSKILGYILHTCDLSGPSKPWAISRIWSSMVVEEFFRQGDLERQLLLPISPMCDRNTTMIPESQISFLEFIVEPTLSLFSDMTELILNTMNDEYDEHVKPMQKPWVACIAENKRRWNELAKGITFCTPL